MENIQHTQGELWRDDDGFIAIGKGDDYMTFADLDCSDADIDEREANKERLIKCWNEYDQLKETNALLLEALKKIANWELPSSGEFWDREQKKPMSYEAAFGSNGERDYIKSVAKAAIKAIEQ